MRRARFARFGRSGEAPSADLRDYGGFDHQRFTRLAAYSVEQPWINDSLLFSETVRAYAITIGCNWRDCVRWVEKSTSNEACSDALFELFPEAKLLQVVRDPRAVFSSRKKRLLNIVRLLYQSAPSGSGMESELPTNPEVDGASR